MEEQAKVPVSLPVARPTKSYWQDPPDSIANLRSSELPATADVVIIGSGITGAAIAWGLLGSENNGQNDNIVMLEARQACSGATGRNGARHTPPYNNSSCSSSMCVFEAIIVRQLACI
jgi:hypothetical protein